MMQQLGIKQKMSTAYHPQTDGQSERTNQTLEQYLRHYLNYGQNNWVQLLPTAQLAYNSARVAHQHEPFKALFGYDPTMYGEPAPVEGSSQNANQRMKVLRNIHEQISQDLRFIAYRSAKYYDQNRLSEPILKKGDKVYLLKRNIRTKRPSAKLDHIRIGPFKILERIGRVNYKLELPETMRIHPVFHVMLLEKAPDSAQLGQERIEVETDTDEYEVEDILDHQKHRGASYYLVKWKGFSEAENTWEPKENLRNSPDLLRQFHRRNPTVGKSSSRREDPPTIQQAEIEYQEPRVYRILILRRDQPDPPSETTPQSTTAHEPSSPSPSWSANRIRPATEDADFGSPSSSRAAARSQTPHPLHRRSVRRPDLEDQPEACLASPLEVAEELAGDTESEEETYPEASGQLKTMERLRASTPPKGTTTKKWNEVLDRHYPRVVQKVKSDQLAWVQKLRNQPVPDGLSHDDWHWIIDDAAEAIENPPSRMNAEEEGYYESLREEAEAVEEYFKDLKYLQSSAVTTRSQERFPLMQREQRPEDKSTRHSEPADLHREQGVGITPPRSDTLQDNREARSVDDGGALGIVRRKRKHPNQMDGDHEHPLYPQDTDKQERYGCRDDTFREGSECYGPGQPGEPLAHRGRRRTPREGSCGNASVGE
jgi:hypothetical protein